MVPVYNRESTHLSGLGGLVIRGEDVGFHTCGLDKAIEPFLLGSYTSRIEGGCENLTLDTKSKETEASAGLKPSIHNSRALSHKDSTL